MPIKIAFRVDASMMIGSGHVMRCLTLADVMKNHGVKCSFISREHPGNLLEVIRERGHAVFPLPVAQQVEFLPLELNDQPKHAAWLGARWEDDASESASIVQEIQASWMVVDHYALDWRWEKVVGSQTSKLLVIDDLADRLHSCDLLVDQNLGRKADHYFGKVPASCRILTGPRYAMLRPEFSFLRNYSLQRRKLQPELRQLLIAMGGVDQSNATELVLETLKACHLPQDCRITVVMGRAAPWLKEVCTVAAQMPWITEVLVGIDDMAQRMADSDLAIGAAGGSSWERCCLGLPTLNVVVAENQQDGARALDAAYAIRSIGDIGNIKTVLPGALEELTNAVARQHMSTAAGSISNWRGVDEIMNAMDIKSE